jgi:hypothetical protein
VQNLPKNIRQQDKALYQSITPEGSQNYEMLYMSGQAKQAGQANGIPADDFNVFATMVYAFADHTPTFAALRNSNKVIRHIDVGTGPSLYSFIASLPYVDELIAIDLNPANIQRLQAIANQTVPVAAHWQAWLEIATVLYGIGSAERLVEIDHSYPHLYDSLRHWPNLDADQRRTVGGTLRTLSDKSKVASNPYEGIALSAELSAKLRPRVGDAIDNVAPLADLVGTADIYTKVFYAESIDNTLPVVAHAETNGIQFAKPGALVVSAHMAKTDGYKGFFTPEELADNSSLKLVEFPASTGFFEVLMGEIVAMSDKYRCLWQDLEHTPQERKMVRQGLSYGGIVIICGLADYKHADSSYKYQNGLELAQQLKQTIRTTTFRSGSQLEPLIINCTISELESVVVDLIRSYCEQPQSSMSLAITVPLLPTKDFESNSVDHHQPSGHQT